MRGSEALRFLGFVAAGDAIDAMDQLGPVTGWDVSVDGLRRLARMLIQEHGIDPLQVNPTVDPELRSIFDFGPVLELPPAQGPPDTSLNTPADLLFWLTTDAMAEENEDGESLESRNRRVSGRLYERWRAMVVGVGEALEEADMKPADNLDIFDFMTLTLAPKKMARARELFAERQ